MDLTKPVRPPELVQFEHELSMVALGVDELVERQHGYRVLMGADTRKPRPRIFETWTEAIAAIERLRHDELDLNAHTVCVLNGILGAVHTFLRVRDGVQLTYLEQVEAYLELRDIWVSTNEMDALRGQIRELLIQVGLPEDLAVGLRRWEHARTVPTDEIADQCQRWLSPAKRASIDVGVPIPEEVTVNIFVHRSPYYAYARYRNEFAGTVEIASNLLWTQEAIKHSICHEAFPGHIASGAAREQAINAGTWSPLVIPGFANTPVSPIIEGLAECGVEMLGWNDDLHSRLYAAYNSLQFAVRTNAAILRHEHGEPAERAIAYMMEHGAVTEEWAVYHERFISDPLWHTSFPHYWHGAKLIRAVMKQMRGKERAAYAQLYGRPQTTSTVRSIFGIDQPGTEPTELLDASAPRVPTT